MQLSELSFAQILLVFIAAAGIGFSKSGFAGVGMIHVVIFAFVFGARLSTGILLPLLIVGDLCAVKLFGAQVQWPYIRRLLVPALIGVIVGWQLLDRLDESSFKPLVGSIILALTSMQWMRIWRPRLFENVPHAHWFAWSLGLLAGITTMLANAAGPVIALYLLAVALPKYQLIATSAWFFLILNVLKLPFSASLGLIDSSTLLLNVAFAPAVALGMIVGRWLVHRIPQRLFDSILLIITAAAALRLILPAELTTFDFAPSNGRLENEN